MAESVTPTRPLGKLDSLPKDELIKYIKKQASQMKDLKKKNEDLNLMLKHERTALEKMEQEQKSWLSRGVSAEFEKKEELQKKERELQMAAHLGQQMLAENDKLRSRCDALEQENRSFKEEMGAEIERLDSEKETIEKTLIMIQNEYKEAKLEAQKLKEALEIAAADHDKEYEKWEEERSQLKEVMNELEKSAIPDNSVEQENSQSNASNDVIKALQKEVEELREQIKSLESDGEQDSNDTSKDNQELKAMLEANSVELKAQDESLKLLRAKCQGLQSKTEELHQLVDMVSAERDESNAYSKQMGDEVKVMKDEREKMIRSQKTLKGKLEKSVNMEEELKRELSALTSDKGELQLMVKNLQREKKTLMQSNRKLKDKVRASSTRQGSFDEGNNELPLEKENDELRKEIKLLKLKFQNEEGELDSLKSNNKVLSKEKEVLKEEVSSLMEKLLKSEQDLNNKMVENEGDKAMVAKLQTRVDELLSTLQSLNEEKMHQETEIEELFKTHDELQIKYDKEHKDKMEKEAAIQSLSDELMKEKDHSMQLQEQLYAVQNLTQPDLVVTDCDAKADEKEITWQKEVENKCNDCDELKRQLLDMEEKLEVERKQRKVLETNFDKKVSSVDEFEANEMRIASMNDDCSEELDRLKREVDELKKSKDSLEADMIKLEEKLLHEKAEEVKKNVEEKEKEVREVEESKKELKRKFEVTLHELENQKEMVIGLRLEIEKFEKDLHNAEEEKEELKRALATSKKICEEKEKECDSAMQEISVLRGREVTLNDEFAELKKTVASSEQDGSNGIERYKKAYKKIKEKFNEVGAINEELKGELQTKAIIIEELRQEISASKDVLEKKVAIENDDGEKLKELLNVVEKKDVAIIELEAELKRYKDSDDCKELIAENNALKQEVRTMSELQEKLDKYECGRIDLDAKVQSLSNESEEIQMKLEKETKLNLEQRSLIDDLSAENMNLKARADELEVKLSEALSDNEKNLSSLREEEEKLSKTNIIIERLEASKEELSVMAKHLIEEKGENETQISMLKADVGLVRNSEAEKILYIGQLEHDLADIKIGMNAREMEIDELRRVLIERENEAQERNMVVSNLESARKQLEEDLSNTTNDFNEQRKLLTDAMEKNESLLSMKEELSSELNDKIRELTLLKNVKLEIEQKYMAGNKEGNLENEIKLLKEQLDSSEEVKCEFKQLQKVCEEKDLKVQTCNDIINEKEIRLEAVNKELSTVRAEYEAIVNSKEVKENEMNAVADELRLALVKLESLEEENREKNEKITKFKSVAVKAKKEIDSMKGKNLKEKKESEETIQSLTTELQNANKALAQHNQELTNVKGAYDKLVNDFEEVSSDMKKVNERNVEAENEIVKLTESLDHIQIALASVENENAALQSQFKEKENCVTDLTRQMSEAANSVQRLREELSEEKSKHDATKSKLTKVSDEFENAKKDVCQMKMISLEMDDYHRTAQALQNKLNESEAECKDARTRIQQLEQDINELNETIACADEKSRSSSQEIEKLTTFLAQKDTEIDDLVSERKDLEQRESNFKQEIEDISAKCEERMIQISDLASGKEKLLLQLKSEKDLHQKDIQTIESKYSRTRTELSLLQEAYENCKAEFESYKIRAQNVLKQQKMKQAENDDAQSLKEKLRLEQIAEELREKLKEANGRLSANLAESEDLEAEYEKLQNRYGELVKDISEKEAQWRERFIGIQSEMKKLSVESEQKISVLSQEKDTLQEKMKSNEEYEVMAQDYEETIKELKEQLVKLQAGPKRQNSREKRPAIDSEAAKEHRPTPEHLKLTNQSASDGSHGLVERPGAEGMDSSELEIIDKSSLPATPISPDSASILDKILSPTEHQNATWPSSPTSSKEESFRLRSALSTAEKNVEHLAELLAETEGGNARLTEQIKLLKTEIRRMQQNQEREEALHNLEYLKNVIIKFMKCNATERECLVPVMSTMLKLTTEEKQFITEFAKGEADQDASANGWSSYVYKWTSFS